MIGFIGLGLMGQPLCQRLRAADLDVMVWNRSEAKYQSLQHLDIKIAQSPKDLAKNCDIILLCVSDTAAVENVCDGEDGLFAGLQAAAIVVDLSSISVFATQQLAARAQHLGAHWVDAPVSGGVAGAESGRLVVMAGGDATLEARLAPVFASFAQRVTWMGAAGCGQATKLCNQLIVAANALLIAEAVALAERAGVDAAKLPRALAGGFADSLPFQILTPRMAARDFEPVQWKVDTLLKDLRNICDTADEVNSPLHLARQARDLLQAFSQTGAGAADLSRIIEIYADRQV